MHFAWKLAWKGRMLDVGGGGEGKFGRAKSHDASPRRNMKGIQRGERLVLQESARSGRRRNEKKN